MRLQKLYGPLLLGLVLTASASAADSFSFEKKLAKGSRATVEEHLTSSA